MEAGHVSKKIETKNNKLFIFENQSPHPLLLHPVETSRVCMMEQKQFIFLAIDFTLIFPSIKNIF